MKFHYLDQVIITGDSFWTGAKGRVIDVSIASPVRTIYEVELPPHKIIWINEDELEHYKGMLS